MGQPKKVGILELAKGMIEMAPEAPSAGLGLLKMSILRPDSKQSIGKVLEHWARKTPQATALAFEDKTWNYQEFNGWANRLAAAFSQHGIGVGDTVAILMENRPEALACVAATAKLGAIAGLLNHNQQGDVLSHSIGLVKPKVLIVSAECQAQIDTTDYQPGSRDDCCFLWHGGDDNTPAPAGWLELNSESQRLSSVNPESTQQVRASFPCFYIFTSGTTGLPKASVMTHYRWLSSMRGVGNATLRLHADDIFYCCLPLYHNNALTVSWASVMSAGACLALDRKFSASRFWDRVRHYNATAFCYIGELLRYLLNQPPSDRDRDHSVVKITGNGLRAEIWAEFEERFGIQRIYEFYGASEANIAFINAFGVSQTAGFTPLPFAIVEFDTDSEQPVRSGRRNWMQKVKRGGVGLLISEVTDKRPFDGYTDPAAGEKKLLRNVFRKGDCWFNTGDLVRDQGWKHIQFVDRVGDTFRWKGENVACGEIEGVIAQNPHIEHGAVYGVEIPGCDGRAGMAAITMKEGRKLNGPALAKRMQAALPAYAVPLFIRVQRSQETTGTFKYRKVELKQQGFDPQIIDEPLYVLADASKGYERLTPELHARIVSGDIRL